MDEEKKGANVNLMSAGNKAVGALRRLYGDRLSGSFEELQKVPFNFGTASFLAQKVLESDADRVWIATNRFKSMIAYDTLCVPLQTKKSIHAMDKAEFSKVVDQYEFEPETYEQLEDLVEWYGFIYNINT